MHANWLCVSFHFCGTTVTSGKYTAGCKTGYNNIRGHTVSNTHHVKVYYFTTLKPQYEPWIFRSWIALIFVFMGASQLRFLYDFFTFLAGVIYERTTFESSLNKDKLIIWVLIFFLHYSSSLTVKSDSLHMSYIERDNAFYVLHYIFICYWYIYPYWD